MSNTVREVLVAARSIVEAGWHQGSYTDGDNGFCARAAVTLAAMKIAELNIYTPTVPSDRRFIELVAFHDHIRLDMAATEVLERNLPEPWTSIPSWNDDEGTVHNDVLAVMDKAISSCTL